MSLETEVAALTQATTNLLGAVNVSKATLDQRVADAAAETTKSTTQASAAAASAAAANTSAGQSAGSAAQSLAIYGSTAAQQAAVTAAQNAASVAAGHAASASSVVQQDLSGVTATALHRSPNAVTAMFVYDTQKDSDGGAWTEKCQHTSWYNEAINGKWLGAQASEAAARAVSGATTGDYFQLTTDGKFYRLNATSGITETFRGNKRDFPRLSAIVAESSNVTVYDLTEPGRPMWRRVTASSCAGVVALNGWVVTAQANTPVTDYARDRAFNAGGAGTVNAVSITALPSAPIDPFTGLRIPTVAMARSTGLSVFNAGALVNSSSTLAFNTLTLSPALLSAGRADTTFYWAQNPGALGDAFALATDTNASGPDFNTGNTNGLIGPTRSEVLRRSATAATVQKLKHHEGSVGRSLALTVMNTHNTGWMTGDIRRAYLADNTVGSTSQAEISKGQNVTDLAGWVIPAWYSVTSVGGNRVRFEVVSPPGSNTIPYFDTAPAAVGASYRVGFSIVGLGASNSGMLSGTHGGAGQAWGNSYLGLGNYFFRVTANGTGNGTLRTNVGVARGANASNAQVGDYVELSLISARIANYDRSYKANAALITGTLTKTEVASAAQLVAYSGFSAANYLQEPYSADLDFGTGEWSVSGWVNTPVTLPAANFPVVGAELVTNGDFSSGTTGWTTSGGSVVDGQAVITTTGAADANFVQALPTVNGKSYLVTVTKVSSSTSSTGVQASLIVVVGNGGGALDLGNSPPGTYSFIASPKFTGSTAFSIIVYNDTPTTSIVDNFSVKEVAPALIADRAHSSGSKISLGIMPFGNLTAEAFDGTTTRTVTTTAAYNTATWLKARVNYTTDGTLAILVNGVQVAATRGNPLLTLNNANAVLTIGNSYALDAPFPGSIALLKLSATVPTAEQAVWMYEQEKHLFQAGAQCCLPDAGAIADLTYDEATDKWIAISATNESEWSGLVRTSVTAVPAGSYTRAVAGGGVQLLARSTTTPGVDITIPAYGLREELVKRAEAAARLNAQTALYDFVGGFTANTTSGNTAILSITNLTYPTRIQGARVTGTGIPANASIADVSGTTGYLSAAATATGTAVQINLLDFALPTGLTATAVSVNGVVQREGPTAAYTRLFDGFREVIRFAVAPGNTAWVQIQTVRSVA